MQLKREQWRSQLGFIWAAVGSAIGLGSIWRFPYVVGENGGATFVLLYLICLVLVGFPVLVSEVLIGRKTKLNPSGSFKQMGGNRWWQGIGKMTIITGFLISSFYCIVAGWTLSYLIQALLGQLTHFHSVTETVNHFQECATSMTWGLSAVVLFLFLATFILYIGVQKGIEVSNKMMIPFLLFLLIFLAIKGAMMPGGEGGLAFIFKPKWSEITPATIVLALGQAFFSLSLGQGTMITYGSYFRKEDNIVKTCFPITLFGICISMLAGVAIFTIVFSSGFSPTSGESLMFQTLPIIFSQISGGYFFALLFFLLLVIAALTSQISAMEPLISYFIDAWKWNRGRATLVTGIGVLILSIPSILSFGLLSNYTLFGKTFFNLLLVLCLNILVPLGGLGALILVGWRWGFKRALPHITRGGKQLFTSYPILKWYFHCTIRYIAPFIIIIIMLDALGIFALK